MARTHKIVHVEPGSELARFLEEIDHSALVVLGDQRFTVTREETLGDEVERRRLALHRLAGVLSGVDAEALKRQIRGDGSPVDAQHA